MENRKSTRSEPARDPAEGAAENVNVPASNDERGGRHAENSRERRAVNDRSRDPKRPRHGSS